MTLSIDQAFVRRTLEDLVALPSVNASEGGWRSGALGEAALCAALVEIANDISTQLIVDWRAPDWVSIRLKGTQTETCKTLLLNGHMDTVGVAGYTDPFVPTVKDGRLYGRGSQDMKAGIAASLGALKALVDSGAELQGDLLLVFVGDEEDKSRGMMRYLEHLSDAERTGDWAAVVTEPTGLRTVTAHRGFAWLKIRTRGRAAHGSLYQQGVDANAMMARVLTDLATLGYLLQTDSHPNPLVGPASLHVSQLHGGTGPSVYAAECTATVEWRSVPGQSEADVVGAVRAVVEGVADKFPDQIDASVEVELFRPAFEEKSDAAIVQCAQRALNGCLPTPALEPTGAPFWTDAALLAEAGIETIILGPSGNGLHTTEEWVEMQSVYTLAEVLARMAVDFCGAAP